MSWVAYNIQPLLHKRKKKKPVGIFLFVSHAHRSGHPSFLQKQRYSPADDVGISSLVARKIDLNWKNEQVNRGKVKWRCFIWFNQLLSGFVKTRLKWLECCCFCCCCVCYLWNLINSSEKSPNVLYCFIAESLGEEKRQTLALVLC